MVSMTPVTEGDYLLKNFQAKDKAETVILTSNKVLQGSVKDRKTDRPWSKAPFIFKGSPCLTTLKMMVILGILNRDWLRAGSTSSIVDNAYTDGLWKVFNSRFSLPQGFLQLHNNLDLIERCDERLLPRWPISPGPFTRSAVDILPRPSVVLDVWKDVLDLQDVYDRVKSYGVPNFRGARVVINKSFEKNVWLQFLYGYSDLQVIDHMQYGWPTGFESTIRPALGLTNHPSALACPEQIDKYIGKEISHKALIGPFHDKPFVWQRVNPLMVRPKKEPNKFRVILDLSYPDLKSVNTIRRFSYDGSPYKLRLPSALDLAELIAREGRMCYLFKLDLSSQM